MYYGKNNKDYPIYGFSERNYKANIFHRVHTGRYNDFDVDYDNKIGLQGYVIPNDYDITPYNKNIVKSIPEKSVLYFDKNSKFPRNKLALGPYKKTSKIEKADFIVLNEMATIRFTEQEYCVFTDSVEIFAISLSALALYFKNDIKRLEDSKETIPKFKGELKILYIGILLLIGDPAETFKLFKNGKYNKPFILDIDLDRVVNNYLFTPDLNALISTYDLLTSKDPETVKLGAIMAAGFNITKGPLTFRVLLCTNLDWTMTVFGGNLGLIKQMRESLRIQNGRAGGPLYLAALIHSLDEEYSEEDIALAKDLARNIPAIKKFAEADSTNFYLDTLPYIPDEYKN